MSPSRPSKPLIAVLTLPLLANIITTLSISTKLLKASPLRSSKLASILLITTIVLSILCTCVIITQSRYDRLLLLFVVPLFTAALAMAVLYALLPFFTGRSAVLKGSRVLRWLLEVSVVPVGAGSLAWLMACYAWLAFGAFQPETSVQTRQQ